MTDDELKRIEEMADARTVDAEVRAHLHRLAADWRELSRERDEAVEKLAAAESDAEVAGEEKEEAEGERDDAIEERDALREKVRNYVRERQDAAVLGVDRCRVDRHFAKLEQLV